ncbi:MAG: acetyl-CoA carboxylase biotin carboxyl carrier protein subunit [Anaerolineae bacterium]|nr:acetyl-CoA carboxylase biotin carboxyl carrier protein subunit [Anaerolineae bacterium]
MPTFDVTVQGKSYHIEIPDPAASPLQVIVDGEAFAVQIAGAGPLSRPAPLAQAPRPAPQPDPLPPPPQVAVSRPAVPVGTETGGTIVAPMPGTILAVHVEVGQPIEAGQVVCTLEAMKMKNPIRATHPGRVAEIAVQPGQTVAYSQMLVRLE